MSLVEPQSIVPFGEVQGLTAALTGAFAEGVDLGAPAAQIRALGESLDIMIAALRLELDGLGGGLQVDNLEQDSISSPAWRGPLGPMAYTGLTEWHSGYPR